ncbi:MAG: D-glycerate dehydrogenase [Chloroflexi bacterium HGW-Chloroflexi-3]|nr:MAG: D-glycerate dehydrogenase [Chloroflexi bacterium HGW-Chloroflexi-3]
MTKPKVFITRRIPDAGLNLILEECDVDLWDKDLPPTKEELFQHVPGVDGILSLLSDPIDDEVIQAAGENLRVISNYAVGYNNIDIQAATQHGIAVGNTPGVLTEATADFAFALMMSAGRRIVEAERHVRAGHWKTWGPSILLGCDFAGATLGIIGFGRIGKAMARRATGFGMRILVYDPTSQPMTGVIKVDFDTLLRESDLISLHTPLTPETRHLINGEAFAKMKSNAVLVNTARGEIVDQAALYDALKNHKIFAAGIDVTDPEPLPMDSTLLELDNLIICPHIASASTSTRENMALIAAQNLLAGLRGERLPFVVNPEIYEK